MLTQAKQKDRVKVDQFVTDKKGRKIAAIIGIKELDRIEDMLEDAADLRSISYRVAEPSGDYRAYSRKRTAKKRV
jgi:hypothetical protein